MMRKLERKLVSRTSSGRSDGIEAQKGFFSVNNNEICFHLAVRLH
jgi:hypothetical protein